MKARLAKRSICECGMPTLAEHIPLGTEYEVDFNNAKKFILICGRCGLHIGVRGVWVESRNGTHPGYLPEEIFEKI